MRPTPSAGAPVPPAPPAEPPPTGGPGGPGSGGRRRNVLIAVLVVVALVAAGVAFVATGDDGGDGGGDDDEVATAAGELFLEPVASVGPDPFTAPVADEPDDALRTFAAGGEAGGDQAPTTSAGEGTTSSVATTTIPPTTTSAPPVSAGASLSLSLASVEGSRPGLYGGTRDTASCDADQLVGFLDDNPEKAEAFAGVLGIAPETIGDYVDGLTPVVLAEDTAVTNHGFRDGEPTPRQSVLQRGTAVLVDAQGVPRVKCFCGNPLLPPEPVDDAEVQGDAWAGFDPAGVSSVDPAEEPLEDLVLVDVDAGDLFARPVGTAGEDDGDVDVANLPGALTAQGSMINLGPLGQFPGGASTNRVTVSFPPTSGPVVGEFSLVFMLAAGGSSVTFEYTGAFTGTYDADAETMSGDGTITFTAQLPPEAQSLAQQYGGFIPGQTHGFVWTADVNRDAGVLTGTIDVAGVVLGFEGTFEPSQGRTAGGQTG